jgi:hypothetical protein
MRKELRQHFLPIAHYVLFFLGTSGMNPFLIKVTTQVIRGQSLQFLDTVENVSR